MSLQISKSFIHYISLPVQIQLFFFSFNEEKITKILLH